MRWISLPEELALPHLLELQDTQLYLRDAFSQILTLLRTAHFESALRLSERAYTLAYRKRDRAAQPLALLLRAGVCWRLGRWEDALDAIRHALGYLELQVSPTAHYNEALAVYAEGLLHWVLRADEKVVETFAYAHQGLVESERYWGFEQNAGRVAACRDVIRWMSSLLDALDPLDSSEVTVILPVYEFVNGRWIRTDIKRVGPYQVAIPAEVVARYLPSTYVPIQLDTLLFFPLNPSSIYIAVRIPADSQMLSQGRRGDLLVVETVVPRSLNEELVLTSEKPFVRRSDGRVEFRPAFRDGAEPAERLVGIPRVLIREGDEP
ncbi:MAG: hypothetical protein ACP5JG_02030 [Anaerolineae bacterium]